MSPRRPFDTTVADFTVPRGSWRMAARETPATAENHAVLMAAPMADALRQIRLRSAPLDGAPAAAEAPVVAAWNVERGRDVADIVEGVAEAGAGIALLTEVDIGMARSGNRDTIDEIATGLGMHAAVAVEFIELGLGDARESAVYAGLPNAAGLHGNAVLSRWPIAAAWVLPLDDGGFWFAGHTDGRQRRIGGRHALAALIDPGCGPIWCVATHFESHSDEAARGREMARLGACLDTLAPEAPVILGGDFNTKRVTADALAAGPDALAQEPLFAEGAARGLTPEGANTPEPTTRRRAWQSEKEVRPARRLDWFFTRGLTPSAPKVWPAVDSRGEAISDHELITVVIRP